MCPSLGPLSDLRAVLQYRFILSSEPFSLFLNEGWGIHQPWGYKTQIQWKSKISVGRGESDSHSEIIVLSVEKRNKPLVSSGNRGSRRAKSPGSRTPWSLILTVSTSRTKCCYVKVVSPGGRGLGLYFYQLSRCARWFQPKYGWQGESELSEPQSEMASGCQGLWLKH